MDKPRAVRMPNPEKGGKNEELAPLFQALISVTRDMMNDGLRFAPPRSTQG
ncbi:hypothetical protein SAMN05216420_102181 [Nitrosospira sp. Nl5]|nr:hypothetical protein SAMN05216420_102181 [Nitrosospira sp. Nl5]